QLAEANKRVANILAKAEGEIATQVQTAYLQEPAEKALYQAVQTAAQSIEPHQHTDNGNYANYTQILQSLATLQQPLDDFFEQVMVNSEDANLKANRLALLKKVRGLFLTVADISELQL
ncbi:glycine--tRNA ligase subunit beta, partial [Salmonella enterica subsp. enterica]|nr:glycine--tRNA ligase subunit beta [Salmonella enterica subsp. enterica serovar Bovismorbificans]